MILSWTYLEIWGDFFLVSMLTSKYIRLTRLFNFLFFILFWGIVDYLYEFYIYLVEVDSFFLKKKIIFSILSCSIFSLISLFSPPSQPTSPTTAVPLPYTDNRPPHLNSCRRRKRIRKICFIPVPDLSRQISLLYS